MLELSDVQCSRGTRRLFDGLNVHVRPGEWLHVQGANGAGKTSLLRMICGLTRPEAGSIRWGGQDILRLKEEYARQLIYIGHAAASKPELSARENLAISLTLQGARATVPAMDAALRAAGLDDRRDLPAHTLSQGQRRRLALARLTVEPTPVLWILDEPFNALDVAARSWLRSLIEKHTQATGIVILTSHDETGLAHRPHQVIAL